MVVIKFVLKLYYMQYDISYFLVMDCHLTIK